MAKNNVTLNSKTNLWVVVGVALVVGLFAGIVGAGISNSANISLSPSNTTDVNTYPDMVSYPGSLFMGYGKMFGFLTSTNNYRTILQLVNTSNGLNTLRIGNDNIQDGTDAVSIYVEGKPNALVVDKNGIKTDRLSTFNNITLYVDTYDTRFSGPISSNSLIIGNGSYTNKTNYVCVNFKGVLIRSATPCV